MGNRRPTVSQRFWGFGKNIEKFVNKIDTLISSVTKLSKLEKNQKQRFFLLGQKCVNK